MLNQQNNFHVITGGPGAGKTAIIQHLSDCGFRIVPEHGRQIIKEQMSIAGKAIHGRDSLLYKELMLSRDMHAYITAQSYHEPIFFDRSIVDILGYTRLLGIDDETHVLNAIKIYRYSKKVLIAPPWETIYLTDKERQQDYNEALETYDAIVSAYNDTGYELIKLPKLSVRKRAECVLNVTNTSIATDSTK